LDLARSGSRPDSNALDSGGSGSSMILTYENIFEEKRARPSGVQKLLTDIVCHQQLNIHSVVIVENKVEHFS